MRLNFYIPDKDHERLYAEWRRTFPEHALSFNRWLYFPRLAALQEKQRTAPD